MLKKMTAEILRHWRIERIEKLECALGNLRSNITDWQNDSAAHHLLGAARMREAHLVGEVERLKEAIK